MNNYNTIHGNAWRIREIHSNLVKIILMSGQTRKHLDNLPFEERTGMQSCEKRGTNTILRISTCCAVYPSIKSNIRTRE